MCKFFGVSKSGYYKSLASKTDKDLEVYEQIKAIQIKSKQTYGYRRVQIALEKQGIRMNHKKILRIMGKYNLLSKIRRKYMYKKSLGYSYKYENLFNQDFSATGANHKWCTDISYISTRQGRLFLSVIRDVHDGKVISYKYSQAQDLRLVADTVKGALKYVGKNTQLHSDQGFQYTSTMYNRLLADNGITPSMSRKATPLDNAPIESFFSMLKTECIYLERPKTIQHAKDLIDEYIDFYNNYRIQLKHRASPNEVRQKSLRLA